MTSKQINDVLINLLPDQFKLLPEDIIYYIIGPFLELKKEQKIYQQIFLYNKYYNKCLSFMNVFSVYEINTYFHQEDYFGIDLNKKKTIENYINYNLKKQRKNELLDDESYQNLKKIVILTKYKYAIIRMNKRKKYLLLKIEI